MRSNSRLPGEDLVERQLHVRQRVARVAERAQGLRDGLDVPAGDDRVRAGERRDLVAAAVELGDQAVDDPLRSAVGARRDTLEWWRDLGDAERAGH